VTTETSPTGLRRVLTFRDLFLFYIVTGFSLRWVATGAAAGPSALVIWIAAALGFFVPLVFSVLELSSRYPDEGGIYVWSKRAFGPFAAFITGWAYWGSNLPYFPALLYFAAANALFIGGSAWQGWSSNSGYFIGVAMSGLTLAVTLNVIGLNVGKWLNNIGAVASWIPAFALLTLGTISWSRFGSATPMTAHAFVPSTGLKDVIFWSTIAFAFGGVGGWFAATARLPFVAGLDRFLPDAFGRLHPRWRTPYVALLVQAAIAALFIFLGQAGTSVRGAYDALVSMGIIAYFIPFLFMFAALIKLQREPAGPEVIRVPGGSGVAIAVASLGFAVTAVSIVLACIPADEEPNKILAVVKVVGASVALIGIGVVVYVVGRRRAMTA
jgi:amino acid transporter